jgi:hypothetical protein
VKRVARTIREFLWCESANERKRRELLEYGPQFPDSYDPSDFSFQALVDSNEPVAFEYELEQGGTAVITIEVKDAPPFKHTLTGEGMGQRRAEQFILPDYVGRGPYPANISVKATRPGPSGDERAELRVVGVGSGKSAMAALPREPSGLEVAALGALPLGGAGYVPAPRQRSRALGIYDTTLSATTGGYVYAFSVGANSKFRRWSAEIVHSVRTGNSDVPDTVVVLKNTAQFIGPNETKTGSWNGMLKRGGRVPRGRYSLFVKAWLSANNPGAWDAQRDSDPILIN